MHVQNRNINRFGYAYCMYDWHFKIGFWIDAFSVEREKLFYN